MIHKDLIKKYVKINSSDTLNITMTDLVFETKIIPLIVDQSNQNCIPLSPLTDDKKKSTILSEINNINCINYYNNYNLKPITNLYNLQNIVNESTDDEINSNGSYDSEDFVFDIRSQDSTEEEIIQPIPKSPIHYNNMIDCCQYSNYIIYLTLQNIYVDSRKIKYNRIFKRIISYDGYLYGLDEGQLYILSTHYFHSNYWVFTPVEWAPKNIHHISVTLDDHYLWMQTSSKCYLYNGESIIKNCKGIRIYGKTMNQYLEIINHTCYVYINHKTQIINNVNEAVLDSYHHIYVAQNHVRLINNKPFYF